MIVRQPEKAGFSYFFNSDNKANKASSKADTLFPSIKK